MKPLLLSLVLFQMFAYAKKKEDPASILISALENEKINENILSSKLYANCKKIVEGGGELDKAKKDEVRKCIQEAVDQASDKDLEEMGNALEITAAKFKETGGSASLKDYLHKRIFNAIHGENAYENKKLKELKFVDQGMFIDLYKSQISKNLILEISQYCLENLGTKSKTQLFLGFGGELKEVENAFTEASKGNGGQVAYRFLDVAKKGASVNEDWTKEKLTGIPDPVSLGAKDFWNDIKEYKYCPKVNKDDSANSCYKKVARNSQQISVLKDQELAIGKLNTDLLSTKYASCSQVVIKNMCEIYRCNNVYTSDSSSILYKPDTAGAPNAENVCKNLYDIKVTTPSSNDVSLEVGAGDKARGQIACNVLKKVERYKNTFAAIKEVKKQNKEIGSATGVAVGTTFKEVYDGKGMDNLTSISSKELVENVDSLGEEGLKDLEDKCLSGPELSADEECQALVGSANEADLTKIQLDTEAETQAYLARVAKLKGKGKDDEMRQYLIENGLHEYAEMYGETLDDEQAIALISDKYKSDRKALINNMQKRFESMTQKTDDKTSGGGGSASTAPTKKEVAENNIEEIKQHKERLETLFNYSNIVSSYLAVSDGKGNETENTRSRAIETEGLQDHDPENAEAYKEYFVDGGVDDSSESISAQGKFIDNILGIGASDE